MISLNHMADFYLLFMVQYYTGEWNYRQEAWCDIQDYISIISIFLAYYFSIIKQYMWLENP